MDAHTKLWEYCAVIGLTQNHTLNLLLRDAISEYAETGSRLKFRFLVDEPDHRLSSVWVPKGWQDIEDEWFDVDDEFSFNVFETPDAPEGYTHKIIVYDGLYPDLEGPTTAKVVGSVWLGSL